MDRTAMSAISPVTANGAFPNFADARAFAAKED
jgi:hypothetical protein